MPAGQNQDVGNLLLTIQQSVEHLSKTVEGQIMARRDAAPFFYHHFTRNFLDQTGYQGVGGAPLLYTDPVSVQGFKWFYAAFLTKFNNAIGSNIFIYSMRAQCCIGQAGCDIAALQTYGPQLAAAGGVPIYFNPGIVATPGGGIVPDSPAFTSPSGSTEAVPNRQKFIGAGLSFFTAAPNIRLMVALADIPDKNADGSYAAEFHLWGYR